LMSLNRMKTLHLVSSMLLFSLIFSLCDLNLTCAEEGQIDFRVVAENISSENIKEHLKFLTQVGSRVTGYPSFFEAANYIGAKFREYGLEVVLENYTITVPMDYGARITAKNGPSFEAYVLWPNHVNPSPYESPPEGDRLVYVGEGDFSDYDGKDVANKFVLMDENSRWYWSVAAQYGAKGIVYRQEEETTRSEAAWKIGSLPLYFPRLFVRYEEGNRLLKLLSQNGETEIYVKANMTWENISVPNIIAYVKGTGPHSEEVIAVSAYFDSWSIVPKLSPGATDALGIATLLELARFFSEHPPDRSIMLVALSGHWQSLWGAREFVDSHFQEVGTKIKAFASLDLATESREVGIYNGAQGGVGYTPTYVYQNPATLNARYSWLLTKFFREYLNEMKQIWGADFGETFVDRILLTHPSYIKVNSPMEFAGTTMFDSEPYTVACYGGGYAYHTTNAIRLYMKTPLDTYDRLNLENLWPQVRFIASTLWGLANEPSLGIVQNPFRFGPPDWGFARLTVVPSVYNISTAFWDPLGARRFPELWKDTLVYFQLAGSISGVAKPSENGEVVVKGVKPYSIGSVDAFVVNRANGRIEWATDLGAYRAPPDWAFRSVNIASANYRRMIAVFKCASIYMFSAFNPVDFSPASALLIYNHLSHGPMIHQSSLTIPITALGGAGVGDSMAFVEPDTSTEIFISAPGMRFPIGLLINATRDNPDGYGLRIAQGQTLRINQTSFYLLKDLYFVNHGRVKTALNYYTYNPIVIDFHKSSTEYLESAQKAESNDAQSLIYAYSFAGWSYEQRSYFGTIDVIFQAIQTSVMFFIALIPFALVLERLTVGAQEGVKRVSATLTTFVIFLIVLGLFHPGFHLATNIMMVLMSFGMLAATLPLLGFVLAETRSAMKAFREREVGVHTAEISRTDAISHAFSASVQNMRRRKFRTLLSMVSICIVVFSLVTFTSFVFIPMPRGEEYEAQPLYEGIFLRKPTWAVIPEGIYHQLKVQYGDSAKVVPRGWFLMPTTGTGIGYYPFSPELKTQIGAILFVDPAETEVTGIWNKTGIEGRWFIETDLYAAIISQKTAANLTSELGRLIDVNSRIQLWGLNLTVVGIFDGNLLYSGESGIIEFDGEAITPRVPVSGAGGAQVLVKPPHFSGDKVIILPFRLSFKFPELYSLMNMALKPDDPSTIPSTAVSLVLRSSIDVYYTVTGRSSTVKVLRYRTWFNTVGIETLLIPLLISGLTILNIMLSSVYERVKEISVYMSVGLSPLHVAGMFLAESLTYALVAVVIGYLSGIMGCFTLGYFNMYPPEFYPNYSSVFVVITVLSSMVLTIISCVYPASKASRLVTPSLERKWRLRPPPKDSSTWTIPTPFSGSKEEVRSMLRFLKEFLSIHTIERTGAFCVEDMKLTEEVEEDRRVEILDAKVRLAPYDIGLFQDVLIEARSVEEEKYGLTLTIRKITGSQDPWIVSNRTFIDSVRKQMLIWRTLAPSEKEKYR